MENLLKEFSSVKFRRQEHFGDGKEYITINLDDPTPYSFKSIFRIELIICRRCGDYPYAKNNEKNIFCKCKDYWGIRCKNIHRDKLNKVLNELVEKVDVVMAGNTFKYPRLSPSCYGHPSEVFECVPDSRRCGYCWRYWCGTCGTGLGGMMGMCEYNKCREGRRNILRW